MAPEDSSPNFLVSAQFIPDLVTGNKYICALLHGRERSWGKNMELYASERPKLHSLQTTHWLPWKTDAKSSPMHWFPVPALSSPQLSWKPHYKSRMDHPANNLWLLQPNKTWLLSPQQQQQHSHTNTTLIWGVNTPWQPRRAPPKMCVMPELTGRPLVIFNSGNFFFFFFNSGTFFLYVGLS